MAQGRNSCRLPLSLPPDPVDELTDPGTQFSNWNPHVMSTTVWALESFVQVGCALQPPPQLAAPAPGLRFGVRGAPAQACSGCCAAGEGSWLGC